MLGHRTNAVSEAAVVSGCPSCGGELAPGAVQCAACTASTGVSAYLSPGHVLASRYEVVGPVGFGGMGMVYRAHDRLLGDDVAIKVLRPDTSFGAEMAQRFLSEIRLARKVSHRNVCRIHDCGEQEGLHYISMEIVDGGDLKHELAERGPLPALRAFDVAIQAAEGLQAIHDAGIVHRDLKTPNIIQDSHNVVKLMDFGLAKEWSAESKQGLTAAGQILGTPEYMSPEQVRGEQIDFRSDLYALGVVIFELFTGDVPFRGETPVATLLRQVKDPPPFETPLAARVPREILGLLAKLLAKKPDARPSSALEVATALRQALAAFDPDSIPTVITHPQASAAQVASTGDPEPVPRMRRPVPEARLLVPPLLRALKHADRDIRAGAARALGQVGPEARAAVGPLAEALKDQESRVRLQAARALGNVGRHSPRVVEALAAAQEQDPESQVKVAAARASARLAAAAAPPPPEPVPPGPERDLPSRPARLAPSRVERAAPSAAESAAPAPVSAPLAAVAEPHHPRGRSPEEAAAAFTFDKPKPAALPRSLRRLKQRVWASLPILAFAAALGGAVALVSRDPSAPRTVPSAPAVTPVSRAEGALIALEERLRRLEAEKSAAAERAAAAVKAEQEEEAHRKGKSVDLARLREQQDTARREALAEQERAVKAERLRLQQDRKALEDRVAEERLRSEETKLKQAAQAALPPPPAIVSAPPAAPRPTAPSRPVAPATGTPVSLDEMGVLPPVGEKTPALPYPPIALRRGVEGVAEMTLLVDERGHVVTVQWVSGPPELREGTLRAIQKWRYRPARKDGVPVKVFLPVRVTFELPR